MRVPDGNILYRRINDEVQRVGLVTYQLRSILESRQRLDAMQQVAGADSSNDVLYISYKLVDPIGDTYNSQKIESDMQVTSWNSARSGRITRQNSVPLFQTR